MFQYAIFILLPTLALARWNESNLWLYYHAVDHNKDGYLQISECVTCFTALDTDQNFFLTLEEVKAGLSVVEPLLSGYEEDVYDFVDLNEDGVITLCDIEQGYVRIDYNKDGYKSVEEFERYLRKVC